jgi:hypothetical protein
MHHQDVYSPICLSKTSHAKDATSFPYIRDFCRRSKPINGKLMWQMRLRLANQAAAPPRFEPEADAARSVTTTVCVCQAYANKGSMGQNLVFGVEIAKNWFK